MNQEPQDANLLFDTVVEELRLKNDAALAALIGSRASTISNMRAGRVAVGPAMILSIIENAHLSAPRIRKLLAGIRG